MIEKYIQTLKEYMRSCEPNFGDVDSVLGMLLKETNKIIYLVCKLCRDHEKSGFVEGIKSGILLISESTE